MKYGHLLFMKTLFYDIILLHKYFIDKKIKTEIPAVSMRTFLPKATNMYYRYNGSLTTPGCFESVIWTVYYMKQTISRRQVFQVCSIFPYNVLICFVSLWYAHLLKVCAQFDERFQHIYFENEESNNFQFSKVLVLYVKTWFQPQ
jgi:hypothetical protein